ncbi:MAG: hypothetical protein AAGM21_06460 [Pseudomonadota bacterium]
MKRSLILVPVVLMGCDPLAPPDGVRTATASEVTSCDYVKNISSTPGVFGPFASVGLEDARNGVLTSAAASGANTVVFEPVEPGERVFTVDAIAYRC